MNQKHVINTFRERSQQGNSPKTIAVAVGLLVLLFIANARGQETIDDKGLIAAAPTPFAAYPAKAPKGFDIRYDKFKDLTTIDFTSLQLPVHVISGYYHSGQVLIRDQEEFYLMFFGRGCKGFCFRGAQLILLIDGERTPLGTDDGLGDEVIFTVPRAVFKRIAAAKLVEYQVGRFEGQWKTQEIENFNTLLDFGTLKK